MVCGEDRTWVRLKNRYLNMLQLSGCVFLVPGPVHQLLLTTCMRLPSERRGRAPEEAKRCLQRNCRILFKLGEETPRQVKRVAISPLC